MPVQRYPRHFIIPRVSSFYDETESEEENRPSTPCPIRPRQLRKTRVALMKHYVFLRQSPYGELN